MMKRITSCLAANGYDPDDVAKREELVTCFTFFTFVLYVGALGAIFGIPDAPRFLMFIAGGTFFLFFFVLLYYVIDFARDDFTCVHKPYVKLHTICWKSTSFTNICRIIILILECIQLVACVNHLRGSPVVTSVGEAEDKTSVNMMGDDSTMMKRLVDIIVMQFQPRDAPEFDYNAEFWFSIIVYSAIPVVSWIALKLHVDQMDAEQAMMDIEAGGDQDENAPQPTPTQVCCMKLRKLFTQSSFLLCGLFMSGCFLPMLYHTSSSYACNFDETRDVGKKWQFSFKEELPCFKGLHIVYLFLGQLVQVFYTSTLVVYILFNGREAGLTVTQVAKPKGDKELYFRQNPTFEVVVCVALCILMDFRASLTVANMEYQLIWEAGCIFITIFIIWYLKSFNNMFMNVWRCCFFTMAFVFSLCQLLFFYLQASYVAYILFGGVAVVLLIFASIAPTPLEDEDGDDGKKEKSLIVHPAECCQINPLSHPSCCKWCMKVAWKPECFMKGAYIFFVLGGRAEEFPLHLLHKLKKVDLEKKEDDKDKNKDAAGGSVGKPGGEGDDPAPGGKEAIVVVPVLPGPGGMVPPSNNVKATASL